MSAVPDQELEMCAMIDISGASGDQWVELIEGGKRLYYPRCKAARL